MSTKLDLVNDAYSQLRISGLTVQPSPSNLQLALYRMERMMAELYEMKGLNIQYNFQEFPSLADLAGVTLGYFQMISTNLALRLIPDFKTPDAAISPALASAASASMSGAIGVSVRNNMRMVQPSMRMPLGNGNTFRWLFWNRYSVPVPNAPTGASTNYILQGETFDYREDFSAWLGENTIASYEILVDPLLTLDSSSDANDPIIDYRITAPIQPTSINGPWQIVLISVTDSIGRTDIRLINFQVTTPPQVGDNV